MKLDKILKKAIKSVESEIEAVREKPSQDVLFEGGRKENHPPGEYHYVFKTNNSSIRYAEEIKAELDDVEKEIIIHPVEMEDDEITLNFPDNHGPQIKKVELEWENDFVLRKLHDELIKLKEADQEVKDRVKELFDPQEEDAKDEPEVLDDERRNDSQREAIVKSLKNRVLFVWGPPGTGKTSTLGYIIANYLANGKKVLFASNTNRAVDVGLLSIVEALRTIGKQDLESGLTRFGEAALENDTLDRLLFDQMMEEKLRERKEEASKLSNSLQEYKKLQEEVDALMEKGEDVPQSIDLRCQMLGNKVDQEGGEDAMEERIDQLLSVNDRVELGRKNLVATTLAKVCTSDLFQDMEFDAVVIDEASMANLPYLLVLAGKAKKHVVAVGDPMQLPPIALTDNFKARDFLEQDIFAYVSGAKSTEDLFKWHDENQSITCFFDTQYRLKQDLAQIISNVFYEGRLKTAGFSDEPVENNNGAGNRNSSLTLFDSSKYGPNLTQKKSDRGGFQPVNEVHQEMIKRLVRRLVLKKQMPLYEIGIIVPFRSTVYDIRNALYKENYGEVEVGTIHTFQGREKRVIIFDTVMSGEGSYGRKRHYTVRPFDEDKNGLSVPRLLNVAFSRSKEHLVVIADMEHIDKMYGDKFLGRLLHNMQNQS